MVKAVLFDIDDTLLDFKACSESSLKNALSEFGLTFTTEIAETFSSVTAGLWSQVENGKLTREELFEKRFDTVFRSLGLAVDGKSFEKRFHSFLYESSVSFPDAAETLRCLSGRLKLFAASNAPLDQQKNRLTNAGLISFLSGIFASDQIGYNKPESGFFEYCKDRLFPIPENEILMVGDSPEADILGAGRCGIETCWFNPGTRNCPAGILPDHIITHLSELKRIV